MKELKEFAQQEFKLSQQQILDIVEAFDNMETYIPQDIINKFIDSNPTNLFITKHIEHRNIDLTNNDQIADEFKEIMTKNAKKALNFFALNYQECMINGEWVLFENNDYANIQRIINNA